MKKFLALFIALQMSIIVFSQTAEDIEGKWNCTWTKNEWKFKCQMELIVNNNEVSGNMKWQALKWPKNADDYYNKKADKTAIEYVRGNYNESTKELKLQGYEKDDPYEIIGLDTYKLILKNKKTLQGSSKTNENNWKGVFIAKKINKKDKNK